MFYIIQRWLCSMFVCLSLTSCGFHLRGFTAEGINQAFPFKTISVSGRGGVANALNKQLNIFKLSGGKANTPVDVTVIIDNENITRKVLTINGRGLISEYRVYLDLQYRILYRGTPLVDSAQLRLFRDYSYTDSAILGKESEQDMLVEEMYKDGANRLLQRTINLLNYLQKPNSDATLPQSKDFP